jgi:hypothetical protein
MGNSNRVFSSGIKRGPMSVIARAGLVCGVLDISAAFLTWAPQGVMPIIILQGIASGVVGRKSFDGGWATGALGLLLHFVIAFSAATVFYAASRKLRFMTERPILSGILYGVAVYLVMYWVVMPIAIAHRRPFSITAALIAIVTHMVCVGLPISLVVHRYSALSPLPA